MAERIDPVLVKKAEAAFFEHDPMKHFPTAIEAVIRVVRAHHFDELGLKEWPSGLATVGEERKTKALYRIYAIAVIGSDIAEIARRALAGIEEPGTPADRRLDASRRSVEQGDQEYWRKRAEAKLAMAVEAFEAILGAEEECGRYSGSQRLAEVAIDRTVLFLRTYGLLSDEKLAELERRGSIGGEARQALSEIEQGDAK